MKNAFSKYRNPVRATSLTTERERGASEAPNAFSSRIHYLWMRRNSSSLLPLYVPRKQQLVCSVNNLLKARISSRSLRSRPTCLTFEREAVVRHVVTCHRGREGEWAMGGTLKCRQEKEEEPKSGRRGEEDRVYLLQVLRIAQWLLKTEGEN